MSNSDKINFYREKPVREFDLNKTMYETIKDLNKDYQNINAVEFLGSKKTYGELQKNVDRLADAYAKAGLKEGDTVAILTISMPIVQENLLALSKLGVTSKWIDLRIKEKDLIEKINENHCKTVVIFDGMTEEINNILSETDIERVIVASPKDYLNPIIKILANLKDKKDGKQIIIPDDSRFIKYDEFLKTGSVNSTLQPVSFEKDRPSLIIQSSGSTGKSKSILHTEYNFNSEMQKEAYSDLQFGIGKKMHIAIPPFIIYGLSNSVYASMAFSMTGVMTPFVNDETVYNDLGKYNFSCAAPVHYRYLYDKIISLQKEIDELEKENSAYSRKQLSKALKEYRAIIQKLSKVEAFVSGGDKISAQELLRMEHTFGKPIINGYGNNELCGAAIISPVYAGKPDSIGIPLKGVEVHAFDDTNKQLEDGSIGELCVHSDSAFVEYVGNESETKRIKQIHDDGKEWVHTGDLGFVDKDGYVFVTGRNKRLIKKEAFKIAPETIESVILNLAEIKDCVVVGVPSEKSGEVPCAFVEIQSNIELTEDEIIELVSSACKKALPDYENPEYILLIEKIPYKNNKHNFLELEEKGKEYVKSLPTKKL